MLSYLKQLVLNNNKVINQLINFESLKIVIQFELEYTFLQRDANFRNVIVTTTISHFFLKQP